MIAGFGVVLLNVDAIEKETEADLALTWSRCDKNQQNGYIKIQEMYFKQFYSCSFLNRIETFWSTIFFWNLVIIHLFMFCFVLFLSWGYFKYRDN